MNLCISVVSVVKFLLSFLILFQSSLSLFFFFMCLAIGLSIMFLFKEASFLLVVFLASISFISALIYFLPSTNFDHHFFFF